MFSILAPCADERLLRAIPSRHMRLYHRYTPPALNVLMKRPTLLSEMKSPGASRAQCVKYAGFISSDIARER